MTDNIEQDHPLTRRKFLKYGVEIGLMTCVVGGISMLPSKAEYLRPPGAINENIFSKRCIKCGNCVQVCPSGALKQLDLCLDIKNVGTPVINTDFGGCIAWRKECLKCVEVCPTGALSNDFNLENQKLGMAHIDSKNCVNCMACIKECAIKGAVLFPNPDGEPFKQVKNIPSYLNVSTSSLKPYIDSNLCIGCGVCAYYCPAKTIAMIPALSNKKI